METVIYNVLPPVRPLTRAYHNVVAVRRVASGYRAMIINSLPPVYVTETYLEPDKCRQDAESSGYLVVELQ